MKRIVLTGVVISAATLAWMVFTDCSGAASGDPEGSSPWWAGIVIFAVAYFGRDVIGLCSKFVDALKVKWSQPGNGGDDG